MDGSAESALLDKKGRGSLDRVQNIPEGDGEQIKRKEVGGGEGKVLFLVPSPKINLAIQLLQRVPQTSKCLKELSREELSLLSLGEDLDLRDFKHCKTAGLEIIIIYFT